MSRMTTLHIIPLQLTLGSDLTCSLVCDDPRASYNPATGLLTINLRVDSRFPNPSQQSVRFVVRDPSPTDTKYYATLHSGYNADNLVHWQKDEDVSRSPYISAESTVEIWSTILAIPADPKAGKGFHGRNKAKVTYQGGGDEIAIED